MIRRSKPKIGLALGSGAARGLAHIGVLKALIEEGISIDMITGSSMGALVGACFARKGKIADLEEIVLKTDWRRLAQLADPNLALLFKGVIHGKKVKELLRTLIGDVEFKDLKIPLAVVATDVNTGEEIVIKTGSVIDAVRASISIPAIFMPVKFNDRFLIDGGIVNPVPVKVAKDMGAIFVIACNVIHDPAKRKSFSLARMKKQSIFMPKVQIPAMVNLGLDGHTASSILTNKIREFINENKDKLDNFQRFIKEFKKKIYNKGAQKVDPNTPNLFETVTQAIYAMEYEIAKLKVKEADVVITPNVGYLAALEFYRGMEVISNGYEAAMKVMPNIRKLIK